MKRGDWWMIATVVLIGVAAVVFWNFGKQPGATAVVEVAGETVLEKPLSQPLEEYCIETAYGFNTVYIGDGQAYIESADCNDQLCVQKGILQKDGDLAVCLPHQLILRIEGGESSGLDDISH